MKAVILINELAPDAAPDELDVLDQAQVVEEALHNLGYETFRVFMRLNLEKARQEILAGKPDVAFNLFEGIKGNADLIHLGSALLKSMRLPYAGCSVESIFITANKVLTKKILRSHGLPTAEWFFPEDFSKMNSEKKYILKPLLEDASVGIAARGVIQGYQKDIVEEYQFLYDGHFFAEEYIDGREFNISVTCTPEGPRMLPPAEMQFIDFPPDKPKIMDYTAKWLEDTFEYENTCRTFDMAASDKKLIDQIEAIVLKCWEIFDLHGYARVDFRVDSNNNPFVLEVNANPCITDGSGFHAAALHSGMTFPEAMKNIMNDLNR